MVGPGLYLSGAPTFDTGKKTQKRGEFMTPPRPTGREYVREGMDNDILIPTLSL